MPPRFVGLASVALLALLAATLVPRSAAQSAPPPAGSALPESGCVAELQAAAPGADSSGIDAETPSDKCSVQLCIEDYASCSLDGPPTTSLQLVMSDEFSGEAQSLAAGAQNPKWTAGNMWYSGTGDWEVYIPQQVATANGSVVLTIDRTGAQNESALSQQGDGVVWNVSKPYKSGWVDSWNKMCFTGGYVETRIQLPGNPDIPGFWPAFWLMGNLGRAGYLKSTGGLWPYSYNTCGGDEVGREFGTQGPIPQRFNACPDPPGPNRTQWGLLPEQGRGAPEIDMIEVKSGVTRRNRGPKYPFTLLPLHTAPLLPNGTFWTVKNESGTFPGPGQTIPQYDDMWSELEFWKGPFATNEQDRPGDTVRDVVGAYAQLDASFWSEYHTFGLHWVPGERIRWFIDGRMVHELTKEALRAQTNSTGYTTYERLIPVEPMYVIFNLALSDTFGPVKEEELPFPSQMKVDYVRVYQDPSAVNTVCSPPDYPTEQYIACNRDLYVITEEEQLLVNATCASTTSCKQEAHMDYLGGDLKARDGSNWRTQVATVRDCCESCQALPECGAYTFSQDEAGVWWCYYKKSVGWTKSPKEGPISGVVYDAGATQPRGTGGSPPPPAQPGPRPSPAQPPTRPSAPPPPSNGFSLPRGMGGGGSSGQLSSRQTHAGIALAVAAVGTLLWL